jgi:hypothetical protein
MFTIPGFFSKLKKKRRFQISHLEAIQNLYLEPPIKLTERHFLAIPELVAEHCGGDKLCSHTNRQFLGHARIPHPEEITQPKSDFGRFN